MPDPQISSPTIQATDARGYHFVETADWWKKACEPLPSFAEVWWPDYSTKIVEDTIDGNPVVIQLWKGWCQRFLGRDDFPGGIGAEVCVYRRIEGKTLPASLPHFPPDMSDFLLGGLSRVRLDRLWWPYPEIQTEIEFDMIHPGTNRVFFSADPETTYWRNRWMRPDSYEEYRKKANYDLPVLSAQYTLRYRINGKYGEWLGA
jgi:hypothetical protein